MNKNSQDESKRFAGKGISRRTFLHGTAAAIAAASTLGFPYVAKAKPEQLVIASGGGKLDAAYKAAYFDTFTKKTGIKIVTTPYAGIAKVKAMIEAGQITLDVLNIDAAEAAIAHRKGYLEPLDWSLADRSSVLPGAAHDDYLHAEVVATVLSWNTDSFPKGKQPTQWEDLLDMEKFPGTRGFWKNATQTLEFGLLADGVPPEKVYPIDVDRSLAALTKIKNDTVFWEHGAQSAQLLIDGEIELGSAWNGRLYDPKKDGAPIDYTFKESLLVTGAWIIVKGTKNAKWAKEFVAHTLDVKNQAEYSNHIPYGPVVKAAYDLIPKERRAVLPDPAMGFWQDFAYWAEHGERIHNAFSEWLVG